MEEKIIDLPKYFFRAILVLAAIAIVIYLRFYGLGSIPRGINVDEASYGYDAYSLLKTGHDVWGDRGLSLKSFGDYKPAGLAYTLVPLIKYFGLNTLTTRLPSAIFGLLTLIITFFLLKYLLRSRTGAFVGTITLALSPWHFGLSRLFYEPNIGLFFIAAAIFCEVIYIRTPKSLKYLIFAAILTAIGGYYYSVLRYLGLGLLGISLLTAQFPTPSKIIKSGLICLVAWTLVATPYLKDMFGQRGLVRLQQEGLLQQFGNTLVIDENRQMCYLSTGHNPAIAKLCYALWNKPGEKIINFGKVYAQLLSPKYLFLNGYQKDVTPENYGAFLEFLLPFYLLGLFYLVANLTKYQIHWYLLSAWLFTAVPVALAGALNIHRNVVGLYFVFLICSYGLYALGLLLNLIRPKLIKYLVFTFVFLTLIWSQSRFIANYFFVYTNMQPDIWQYDTPDLMSWLGANNQGRKINYYDYDFGSLYYAFYNQLDPRDFQLRASWSQSNQYGWTHVDGIGTLMHNQGDIWSSICRAQGENPSELLVVKASQPAWEDVVLIQFRNYTGIHVLHEIYDSQSLYDYLKIQSPKVLTSHCGKLK